MRLRNSVISVALRSVGPFFNISTDGEKMIDSELRELRTAGRSIETRLHTRKMPCSDILSTARLATHCHIPSNDDVSSTTRFVEMSKIIFQETMPIFTETIMILIQYFSQGEKARNNDNIHRKRTNVYTTCFLKIVGTRY